MSTSWPPPRPLVIPAFPARSPSSPPRSESPSPSFISTTACTVGATQRHSSSLAFPCSFEPFGHFPVVASSYGPPSLQSSQRHPAAPLIPASMPGMPSLTPSSKRRKFLSTTSTVKARLRRCARATFKNNSDGERPMPNPPATEGLDARILAAVQDARQPRPKQVRPIIVIGAGGIVRAAHLPAYEKAGFPVIGLMDQEGSKAAELASGRGIPRTFSSVAEAVRFAPTDAIFDVAVPASQF